MWVQALLAAGYQVCDWSDVGGRYREQRSTSGAKSNAGDAHVLAEMVRLDRVHHRQIGGDSPMAEAVKLASGARRLKGHRRACTPIAVRRAVRSPRVGLVGHRPRGAAAAHRCCHRRHVPSACGGADGEQRGAPNGAERLGARLTCSDRRGATCGPSCLCWSAHCQDFVDTEEAQRLRTYFNGSSIQSGQGSRLTRRVRGGRPAERLLGSRFGSRRSLISVRLGFEGRR